MILFSVESTPLSARQIAEKVGLDSSEVVNHLIKLKRKQMVHMIEGDPILYEKVRT